MVGYGKNKLTSWETLTGTRPSIESDRTIATVSFPLKSAIQRKTEGSDVPVNDAKNDAKNISQRQRNILELIHRNIISLFNMLLARWMDEKSVASHRPEQC